MSLFIFVDDDLENYDEVPMEIDTSEVMSHTSAYRRSPTASIAKTVILWATQDEFESLVYPPPVGSPFIKNLCSAFKFQNDDSNTRHQVNLRTAYKRTEAKLTLKPIWVGNKYVGQIPESVGEHSFTFRKADKNNRCKRILYYDYNARQSGAIENFVQKFESTIMKQQSYDDRTNFPFKLKDNIIDKDKDISQIDLDWIHRP